LSGSREAEIGDSRACASEDSADPGLKRRPDPRPADRRSSYGDPVLEWWRPGGSVLAIKGQGSQAYLSLPPSREGVSYLKQGDMAPIKAWDSVRMNGMAREPAKAAESSTSPEPAKDLPATGQVDG